MNGETVLVYSCNLVVVLSWLIFGALLVHWCGSPAVHHVEESFVVVLVTQVALHHRQGRPAAKVTFMSAVAAKTGCGHLVITGFSDPLQRWRTSRVEGETRGRVGSHVQLCRERPRRLYPTVAEG